MYLDKSKLQALQPHVTGFQATYPHNSRTSQGPDKAYVHDTDLWLTGISPSTPSMTLTSSLQRIAQVWEDLLFASGNALALQKCFYHLVQWQWTPHSFSVMSQTIDSPTTVLQMTSRRSTSPLLIPWVKTFTGKCTLGICLAPDGLFTQELAHRQDQTLTWVCNITASPLTRDKVNMAYCSMWRPSFEYPLPITCFTKQQCQTLKKSFTGPFLSNMGISSKTLRKLIFAPYYYCGFTFPDTLEYTGSQRSSAPDQTPLSPRSSKKPPMTTSTVR